MNSIIDKKEMLYYFLVGGVATFSDWGTFYVLDRFFDLRYQYALLLSLFMGAIVHYVCNKKITFKCSSKKYVKQIAVYCCLSMVTYFSSAAIMSVMINFLYLDSIVSRVLTTFVMLVPNYLLHKHITFKQSVIVEVRDKNFIVN